MTRWQRFYLDEPGLASISASACAHRARELFQQQCRQHVLDLGCGTGRDTARLADGTNHVVGLDAAFSGLKLAQARFQTDRLAMPLVTGDARRLPFSNTGFDGIYCFGLLHEFTTETAAEDVRQVMEEIQRVLKPDGLLVLTTLAGEPQQGLPHVRLFTEPMFVEAAEGLHAIEKQAYSDIGCTGQSDYHVWYGVFRKN